MAISAAEREAAVLSGAGISILPVQSGSPLPLLAQMARIYVSMPAEWGLACMDRGKEIRATLRRLRQSVLRQNEALFAALGPGGKLLGFAWMVRSPADKSASHLRALWVGRSVRGKGLGSILLNRVEKRAKALGATTLTTNIHGLNASMLALAMRHRFSIGFLAAEKDLGAG
jgi:GNAT superfamily N-acetyltransferase